MYDLKIKNAKIVDGTGLQAFHGDIAVIDVGLDVFSAGNGVRIGEIKFDIQEVVCCNHGDSNMATL